jgi:hypothetical protein
VESLPISGVLKRDIRFGCSEPQRIVRFGWTERSLQFTVLQRGMRLLDFLLYSRGRVSFFAVKERKGFLNAELLIFYVLIVHIISGILSWAVEEDHV